MKDHLKAETNIACSRYNHYHEPLFLTAQNSCLLPKEPLSSHFNLCNFFSVVGEEKQAHPIPPASGKAEARLGEAKSHFGSVADTVLSAEVKALHEKSLLENKANRGNRIKIYWGGG